MSTTPPPKQERSTEDDDLKPSGEIPDDKEYKYDPQTGGLMEVDPNRHHNRYPSCDGTTRVAKCVYCEKVKDKVHMRCLGQNYHEKGSLRYVWACKPCNSSNPAWQKISKQYKYCKAIESMWNYHVEGDKPIKHSQEEEKAVGGQIVEKKMAEIDAKIVKALSKRRKERVEENRKKFVEKFGKKKKEVADEAPVSRGVVAKREKKGADDAGSEVRSKLPRWKRKGRTATVRRAR